MTDLYAITPEERATYTAFSTTMWRQLVRPLPQTLWYYTNASTFGRILKTGEVWSTCLATGKPGGREFVRSVAYGTQFWFPIRSE